jgi:tRNA pseudouridine38-40 synthase
MEQNNIKLVLSYDGTNYQGFQSQKNNKTIEEVLIKSISKITKKDTIIYYAGRTDTGVHAEGQVINFYTDKTNMEENNWFFALNAILPKDIRVIDCKFVDINFNSRKNCIAREYWYYIVNSNIISAMQTRYMVLYPYKIDIDLMQRYCKELIGKKDFSSFSSSLDESKSKCRNIYMAKFEKVDDIVIFKIIGNAFLHHMIRTIIGTFLMLNKDSKPPSELKRIIESKDRNLAGINFAAKGLVFKKAFYDKEELKKSCPDYAEEFFTK